MFGRKSAPAPDDADLHDPDVIIPVMGTTGAGKSTFINMIIGPGKMVVGHKMESCTIDIKTAEVDPDSLRQFTWLKNRRVFLVDTPGFDDTYTDDVETLEKIASWLKESYHKKVLGGVIYLHDISIDRLTNSARRNLMLFNKLCGEDALPNVVLGLTKTERIERIDMMRREANLKVQHWNKMIEKGVRIFHISSQHSSDQAWELLKSILTDYSNNIVLNIQREIVEKKKLVPQTEAGIELRYSLQQIQDALRRRTQLSGGLDNMDDVKMRLNSLSRQLQSMEIPLSVRLRRFLGL